MTRYGITAPVAIAALGLFLASPVVQAQAPRQPINDNGTAGGLRYIEPGQMPVMVHPTVEASGQAREASRHVKPASTANNLYYHGGAVEPAPRVYLVFWGSQWNNNDPSGEASLLEGFFGGVFGSSWLNTVVQYCEGVTSGTYFCNGAGTAAGNGSGNFAGFWYDSASAAPSHPHQSQIANEAGRAAAHFGNKTAGSNANAQYVIATAHGFNANGFGTQYCAWHSSTSSSYGNLAYTNLPYITDAGANCGANFNGLGSKAGITIVSGHEMAETITDQFPNGGWLDSSGAEIGDKCAWISSGQGASTNITLSGKPYAVQSLWSNAFNNDSGGCVISY